MGINVGAAQARANELRDYATRLREAKSAIQQVQGGLRGQWQAEETARLHQAIEAVERDLSRLSMELGSLAGDIVTTAYEIRREEEEAERRAREAAEAAARAQATAARTQAR